MEQHLDNNYLGLKEANVKMVKKKTDKVVKSNKCNQCEYASSRADHLRTHLKIHSGEKFNNATCVAMHPLMQETLGDI